VLSALVFSVAGKGIFGAIFVLLDPDLLSIEEFPKI